MTGRDGTGQAEEEEEKWSKVSPLAAVYHIIRQGGREKKAT